MPCLRERLRYLVKNNRILSRLNGLRRKSRKAKACAVLQSEGVSVARNVVDVLAEADISCFLTFGSLLGVVRESRFLLHDDDIDFGIIVDAGFDWGKVESALGRAGYSKVREFSFDGVVTEQAYSAGDMSLDIFGFFPASNGESLVVYAYVRHDDMMYENASQLSVKYYEVPVFESIVLAPLAEASVPIPDNPEAELEVFYGLTWRIPDLSWANDPTAKDLGNAFGVVRK